ncbi:MAG: DUF4250 domain-containing protein [Lachnospiraceae bacterium]|nr:DUF4250 domain-containing protein [Lachnospiraceae bacterium]
MPKDPVMLLSYVNTLLRDHYDSLEDLCKGVGVPMNALSEKLSSIDYHYDRQQNQFI